MKSRAVFCSLVGLCASLAGGCGENERVSPGAGSAGEGGSAGVAGSADVAGSAGVGGVGATSGSGGLAGEGGSGNAGAGGQSGTGGQGAGGGQAGEGGGAAESGSGGSGAASGAGGSDSGEALVFTEAPVLQMSSNPNAPLWGRLTFATNRSTSVRVTTTTATRSWHHDFEQATLDHTHTLLRFIPGTQHQVQVTVQDAFGQSLTYTKVFEVVTEALPTNFPQLSVPISNSAEMEPGVTLFGVPDLAPGLGGYVILLDDHGQVVWYLYDAQFGPVDLRRLANGNLFWSSGDRRNLLEVDMRGMEVRHFTARGPSGSVPKRAPASAAGSARPSAPIQIAADSFHHEALELPSGNFLVLSSEQRAFANYPTSEIDPTPRASAVNLVGDVVVEFSPAGTVVGSWPMLDLLDPYHFAWDSFGGWWHDYYADPTNIDWAHANAVIQDPRDGNFIVSMRHQDTVFKFTRSGEIRWILSDPANWSDAFKPYLLKPRGDAFTWQYHQHSPDITSRGTLLLFDNGDRRAAPPTEGLMGAARYSRAVEFEIDETALEVSTAWDYGTTETGGQRFYSAIVGDADELPRTGNVLVTIGGILDATEGQPTAIIREVTHTTPAEIVLEIKVEDDNPAGKGNRLVYRAERLADVYPE